MGQMIANKVIDFEDYFSELFLSLVACLDWNLEPTRDYLKFSLYFWNFFIALLSAKRSHSKWEVEKVYHSLNTKFIIPYTK